MVTVTPKNQKTFEKHFGAFATEIGQITDGDKLNIKNILEVKVNELDKFYKEPLKDY